MLAFVGIFLYLCMNPPTDEQEKRKTSESQLLTRNERYSPFSCL